MFLGLELRKKPSLICGFNSGPRGPLAVLASSFGVSGATLAGL